MVGLFLHNSFRNRGKNCCSLLRCPAFGHSFLEFGLKFNVTQSLVVQGSLFAVIRASHLTYVDRGTRSRNRPKLMARPAHPAKSDSKTRGRGRRCVDAYIYSDWNTPRITCLFHLLEKEGDTMLTIEVGVCALSNIATLFFSLRQNGIHE